MKTGIRSGTYAILLWYPTLFIDFAWFIVYVLIGRKLQKPGSVLLTKAT